MTFTTTFTNEDICNLAKLVAEIEPTAMTQVYEAFAHNTSVDFGHMKATITTHNTASIEISPELFGYICDNMLDVVGATKMISRVFMRMFGDITKYIKEPVVIQDGKVVENEKVGNPDLENIRMDNNYNPDAGMGQDDGAFNV